LWARRVVRGGTETHPGFIIARGNLLKKKTKKKSERAREKASGLEKKKGDSQGAGAGPGNSSILRSGVGPKRYRLIDRNGLNEKVVSETLRTAYRRGARSGKKGMRKEADIGQMFLQLEELRGKRRGLQWGGGKDGVCDFRKLKK